MLRHQKIDRICCFICLCTLLLAAAFTSGAANGALNGKSHVSYENLLFDSSKVHQIDIATEEWENFLEGCTDEQYVNCSVAIDGEIYRNVAIRAKGNTSLSNVAQYGNKRYSFKLEFDHYSKGQSYYGLDKLSLNNLIQDNTLMKDYLAYTLMNKMGVPSPLCSFVWITVNGEPWGLYLAVEGLEDGFLSRMGWNGELYKPDSMSFGAGRGNGREFDMNDFADENRMNFDNMPQDDGIEMPGGMDGRMYGGFVRNSPELGEMLSRVDWSKINAEDLEWPQGIEIPKTAEELAAFDWKSIDWSETEIPEKTLSVLMRTTDFSVPDGKKEFRMGEGMGSSDVKLQYIDDDADSYANIFNNAKTDITDQDKARLIVSLKTLSEGGEAARSVVDTDEVTRYLAVHNFLCNEDSYTGSMVHNYYLYEEGGIFRILPWDYNLSMGGFGGGTDSTSVINSPVDTPVSNGSIKDRPLVSWIFDTEEDAEYYHSVYSEFIGEVYDSGWLAEELEHVTALISPYMEKDPTAFCTYDEFLRGAETLMEFLKRRCESVKGQLDGSIPATEEKQKNTDALINGSDLNLSAMGGMGGGTDFGHSRNINPGKSENMGERTNIIPINSTKMENITRNDDSIDGNMGEASTNENENGFDRDEEMQDLRGNAPSGSGQPEGFGLLSGEKGLPEAAGFYPDGGKAPNEGDFMTESEQKMGEEPKISADTKEKMGEEMNNRMNSMENMGIGNQPRREIPSDADPAQRNSTKNSTEQWTYLGISAGVLALCLLIASKIRGRR